MRPQPHTPTNEHANQDGPDTATPVAYEPPVMTVLGTLEQLTRGANPGSESDLTFAGSGVH